VDGLAAGLDGFEHMSFMTADGVDQIPAEVLTGLVRRNVTVSMTLGMAPVPGAAPPPGMAARLPALVANGQRIRAAGANIVVGTDAGIDRIKPPDAIRWSLAQLCQIGMTGAEALWTCTGRAATALGLGDRKGRLSPGCDADIFAVDGDPVADPAALQAIRAVFVRGTMLRG
jgi:imidazolonepropionase-like amidohydrolase